MFGANFEYGDPRDRETVGQRKQRKAGREGSVFTNGSSERSTSPTPSSIRKTTTSSSNAGQKQQTPSVYSQKPKSRFGFFGSKSRDNAASDKKPAAVPVEPESLIPEPKISLTSLDMSLLHPRHGHHGIYKQPTPPVSDNDISRQPPLPPPNIPVPPTPDDGPSGARTRPFFPSNQRIASNFNLKPISTGFSDEAPLASPRSARLGSTGSYMTSSESSAQSMHMHSPLTDTIDPSLQSFYLAEHELNYKFRRSPHERPNSKPRPLQISSRPGTSSGPKSAGLPAYDALGYAQNLAVDSKSPEFRSPSRASDKPSQNTVSGRSSFQAALQKMENAGLKIMFKRLSEDWGGAQDFDNVMMEEIAFEQRVWALVAAEWLTFGKALQSNAHEFLLDAHVTDGRRLLHLHGSAADGWFLAAKYPNVTVYSVSSQDISNPACQWSTPLNHHALYIPQPNSPLPFPDNYFDVISTKSFPGVLQFSDWIPLLKECNRILRPGGWIELQIVDPALTKQGDLLREWLDTRIIHEMIEENFSIKPSDDVLGFLQETGFDNVKRSRIALPASFNPKLKNIARGQGPDPDAARVMVLVGRHFYEELYRSFNPMMNGAGGNQIWWQNKAIKHECEALNTCFGLTFAFAQKI
ncbi:hypothetical protein DRE_04570 [Drechslerella stenobrocha 248]|uniref:Uncharacterized protein n=1 Tax=Drechslerella stenobrocha 248 TaxID=1043628 RepID=W7I101_9PEZI|nr:hypothetical protein DRE_04570 [Drechslerella stenobrocha 248]